MAVRHDTLKIHEYPGFQHKTLASRDVGGSSIEIWSQTVASGAATPPHRHECEEVVVLLRGKAICRVGRRTEEATGPCTLVIPAGAEHQITFTEDSELLGVMVASPAPILAPDGTAIPVSWVTPARA